MVRRGEAGRRAFAQQSEVERRRALADAAGRSLARIADVMKEASMQVAPSASASVGLKAGWTIELGQAHLRLAPPAITSPNPWGSRGAPVFEVVAFSFLDLQILATRHGYEGRSHSLWYCDAQNAGQFQ